MKRLIYILIAAITLCAFVCCSDEEEPAGAEAPTHSKWENHVPLNKNDSIAIVALFKNLEIENSLALQKSIDIYDYRSWDSVNFKYYINIQTNHDVENNEMRICGIYIYPTYVLQYNFMIPEEISLMDSLKRFSIIGIDAGAYSKITKEVFDCPLEYFEISGKAFSGSIPAEIKKVSGTLKELRVYNTYIDEIPEEIATLKNLTKPAWLMNNNVFGKVPLFFRELPHGAILDGNSFNEMDWRYFTEDIGVIPYLRNNIMKGEIPEELFGTERFNSNKDKILQQKTTWGWTNVMDAF